MAAQDKLDVVQKRCALELLDGADPTDPVVAPLRRLLAELDAIPAAPPSRAARWAGAVRAGYLRFIEQRACRPIVGWLFAIWALVFVAWVFEVWLDATAVDGPARRRLRSAADGLASPASQ